MKRGPTGKFEPISIGGEKVRAFIPMSLPPVPPLEAGGPHQVLLEKALLSVGRLDSITSLLPDPDLFLYAYIRKEAVLSSQIEGTQSSIADLLLFELKEAPGVPLADVVEVSRYVAAMQHGMKRLRSGFPLSNRLIREIHDKLLSGGRGTQKDPGEFRSSQNWLGGRRPSEAHFVPPPPQSVQDCMKDLESFLHDKDVPIPALIKAGLAHVQFETIHPFLDGNGRVGRLLISLFLCQEGILQEPILYLSLHFKKHRSEYYRLLDQVRSQGDWESWMEFFLNGVQSTADGAVRTAQRLSSLFEQSTAQIQTGGRAAGSAIRVHDVLRKKALTSLKEVCRQTGLSFPAASAGMDLLVKLKIANELTGRKRNRVFAYTRYLSILNEGT